MKIASLLEGARPVFSFEFFPPKTEEGRQKLFATIDHLAELQPSFVSVTYGAGGSTRDLTVDLTRRIKREIGIEPMAHLTCVGHTKEEIGDVVRRLLDNGVENVLALRGDPPKGQTEFTKVEGGFGYANELVEFLRGSFPVCIGGASYPEGHVENPNKDADLENLTKKTRAGVDFLVTQLFFDNRYYFEHVRKAREHGIWQPIIPGIMPVTNVAQLERFTSMCGATIPPKLMERLEKVRDDDNAVMAVGIEWALKQCRELLAGGAPGIHFYTLNRSLSTRIVYLGLQGFSLPGR